MKKPLLYLREPWRSLAVWAIVLPPFMLFYRYSDPFIDGFFDVVQPEFETFLSADAAEFVTLLLLLTVWMIPFALFMRTLRLAFGEEDRRRS